MENKNSKVFKINIYWLLIIAIFTLLVGFGVYQFGKPEQDQDSTTSQTTTTTIRTGDIRVSAIGSGTLISAVEFELGFESGGVVEEILVETGDEVVEGQLLARLDDENLNEALVEAEQNLRELTSDAAIAATALEIAESQKAILSAESELSFFISPYVLKSELRLRDAERELHDAIQAAALNPSDELDQKVSDAQAVVDNAELSLALNWETYYEEYVPDFFNFRWRDRFGGWHDYFDPPSEMEVAVVWAELAAAEARLKEAEIYLTVLTEGVVSASASGTKFTALEYAVEAVVDAQESLEASRLIAPFDGMVVDMDMQVLDKVGTSSILTIAQLEPSTLEASFDEGDWRLIKEGNPVEVIFDSLPEKTYSGQIAFVDPTLVTSQNSTMVSAHVELETSITGWVDIPLLSSATIEVIDGETNNAILLPIDGLQEDVGAQGTVVVEETGEYITRQIEIGLRDLIYVEVTDGLSVGDVVLIGNY